MRFMLGFLKIATVLALAAGAWQLWAHWFPPVPKASHDPLGMGYPDDPSKPESLKFVEALTIEKWDDAIAAKRDFLDNKRHFDEFKASMDSNESLYFRSEAELDEAARFYCLMNVYHGLLRTYDYEHATNKLETDYVEIEGYLTNYLNHVRGIRDYNINKPEDRKIIEAAGVKIPKAITFKPPASRANGTSSQR